MSLPYLADFGWEAHVLAVEPKAVEGFQDPDLMHTLPEELAVTRVGAAPTWLTRLVGCGSLGLRALWPLERAGNRLLKKGGIDVVFFSTSIFPPMSLGPRWKRRFGVPYVLDMQDPWVSDYHFKTGVRPPGGWLKYRFAQWQARHWEPGAMQEAAQVLSVSPAYPVDLQARYPSMSQERFTVLPFGASERDVEVAGRLGLRHGVYDPGDGLIHWSYLGRGGPDMAKGLRGLFLALRSMRESDPRINRLRLHFVGTSYAVGARAEKTVEPIAREVGVADLVIEQTERIPYLRGLALLRDSHAVMIVSSDDPGYSASKVYPCVLARRPLLAILHEASLVNQVIQSCRAGELVGFGSQEAPEQLAVRLRPALGRLLDWPRERSADTDWKAFDPYTAREMTRRQCDVFDRAARTKRTIV
jgi:hypothetical protein